MGILQSAIGKVNDLSSGNVARVGVHSLRDKLTLTRQVQEVFDFPCLNPDRESEVELCNC